MEVSFRGLGVSQGEAHTEQTASFSNPVGNLLRPPLRTARRRGWYGPEERPLRPGGEAGLSLTPAGVSHTPAGVSCATAGVSRNYGRSKTRLRPEQASPTAGANPITAGASPMTARMEGQTGPYSGRSSDIYSRNGRSWLQFVQLRPEDTT